jgi:hypothetical protein
VFTGFPTCNVGGAAGSGIGGPFGVLDDGSHFFVADGCNYTTYRFPTTGGSALFADHKANGITAALALDRGVYFATTRNAPTGVYEFSPTTFDVSPSTSQPQVATPTPPEGMAVDPLTGDLYVGGAGASGGGLYRIQNPGSASPIVTTIASDSTGFDGVAVSADGSRLYAERGSDQHVVGFQRVGGSFGGAPVLDVSVAPHGPDGLAVAPPNTSVLPNGGGTPVNISNDVFVNSNDGTIERIDVNNGNAVSIAAAGGTRGDFATVGPDGCMYATQESSVEKLTPCLFADKITATGNPVSATEGSAVTAKVATFTDPNHSTPASAFTATIDWGDGSSSAGTVSGANGSFTVTGTHTYNEEGSFSVRVQITETSAPSDTATTTSIATVADASLAATCAAPAVSPQSFSSEVAALTDQNPDGSTADFTATIQWGDGTSSSGTVSGPTGGPYAVSGSHTYTTTGPVTITTSVSDDGGSDAKATCNMQIFVLMPFTIGDRNSSPGTKVTFWGAQWWKLNTLSGGPAAASFKGFVKSPSMPACGVHWTTRPGNSPPPTKGKLPAYIGVIVASKITKSGSTISGDTKHIVVVKTNPGYEPNPGHPGTGVVQGQYC